MSRKGDSHRQQRLFSNESGTEPAAEAVTTKDDPSLRSAQLFTDHFEWQALPEPGELELEAESPPVDNLAHRKKKSFPVRMILLGCLLIVVVLLVEAVRLFNFAWANSPLEAGLYGAGLALCALGLLSLLLNEVRKWISLRRAGKRRNTAAQIFDGESSDDIVRFCTSMTSADWQEPLGKWQSMLNETLLDKDVLVLYERYVVAEQDKAALSVVARWSSEAAVMVALSPLAALDMLLIAWRNLRMLDAIARCYNVELGWFSRWKLLRQVLLNVAYAGVSETVMDLGLQSLGADVAGKISGRAAQGVGAGLLTARLGIYALRLCRPLPYQSVKPPRLRQVSGQIINVVKAKLRKVVSDIND